MRNRLIWVTLCIIVLLFSVLELQNHGESAETFSKNIVKYGSKGSDVRELQGRLKHLGFYYGNVDGDYGYRTLRSTKWFQGDFGLKVDGVVGAKTKLKLWEATKAWAPGADQGRAATGNRQGAAAAGGAGGQAESPKPSNKRGFSDNDIKLMANAVYGEARGESFQGQVAVAAVILNRVNSQTFPNTVSGVIFEPRAFTAVADGQIWLEPNESARKAVQDAINGMDPSDGCIYYFNPDTATSAWIWSRPQYKKIGKHIFCR
jgi:N-acetylmuramoyl-L-alanine amidase